MLYWLLLVRNRLTFSWDTLSAASMFAFTMVPTPGMLLEWFSLMLPTRIRFAECRLR